ncbi:hypothetical protein [Acinetobacter terrae]|uniref:Uncharacterized protein n=1 Tax=Acinetobacter terrae TaxID=2731247 RepID=A0A8E4GL64_9GAMM|nr:hypothetical protein [Acinetobacter terrae]NNH38075.1 hypothetical protein [Acinetobacter terrae]
MITKQFKIEKRCSMLNFSYMEGSYRMKRLKDFKITERISRQTIEVLPIQFGDDEATRRIVLHHAKRVILQYKEEIQKLAYK